MANGTGVIAEPRAPEAGRVREILAGGARTTRRCCHAALCPPPEPRNRPRKDPGPTTSMLHRCRSGGMDAPSMPFPAGTRPRTRARGRGRQGRRGGQRWRGGRGRRGGRRWRGIRDGRGHDDMRGAARSAWPLTAAGLTAGSAITRPGPDQPASRVHRQELPDAPAMG
jgi:hypothetical protein